MAAQKRKSVLVEPPAKRQKLDKNSKLVSTNKERKLLDAKSNKNTVLKKEIHRICTKTTRSSVIKSINRSSIPSSQTRQVQKYSKQTSHELKKKTCKTGCVKKASLKPLGKLSSTKTSLKSSKMNDTKYLSSTKTSSKSCPKGKGQSNSVKSKTSCETKKQKSSADIKKCSTEAVYNRRSALHIRTTHKNLYSETKLKKENSKKDRTTKNCKFFKSNSGNLEVQNSKTYCTKKLASQSIEQTRTKTLSDKPTCGSDQGKRAIRSTSTSTKKSPVRIKQEQLHFTKTKEVPWKEMVKDIPQSQPTVSHDEHQTRRSLRLQQSSNVPTISLRSRKIEGGNPSTVKHCTQMKKKVPQNEKPKSIHQKMEQKSVKNVECKNRETEIPSFEKMGSLKEKKHETDSKISDLTIVQDKVRESRNNLDCNLQESKNGSDNTTSFSATSTCSAISKENESVHKNGKISVKAKRMFPAPLSPKPAYQPEDVMKSKKISILELCEEIAGEIESDTVEVKRDYPNTEYGKEKERDAVVELPQSTISTEKETNRNSQCKRFFPSKKGMSVKCTVNGRHSTANKTSKWTKIKLKKINHVNQNLSISPSTPKLDLLKCNIPEKQQSEAVETHLPDAQRKLIKTQDKGNTAHEQKLNTTCFKGIEAKDRVAIENGLFVLSQRHCSESTLDESFNLHLDSSPEKTAMKIVMAQPLAKEGKKETAEIKSQDPVPKPLVRTLFSNKTTETNESRACLPKISLSSKCGGFLSSEEHIQKLKEAAKDSDKQLIIDAGQKRFGAISCNICGMLYTASNPEDETQHLLFHSQFISAVKYVGWKKERILAEYPDGKMIMVLPDDPKYALRKVDEIREMVDNDLGFQQAPLTCSRTKTLLFISNDKKVTGCLIAEHIQWGYRVIEEKIPEIGSENEKVTFERQKAWCCSTSPEPAICGISRIWVFSMMRRKKIASRMLECLRLPGEESFYFNSVLLGPGLY
ncbi:N-acetyltransferase ESCO1 isoform X2 [Rhineura floridana]|uniref:N-acetyltransferase ESCO1 isoform X2 n=1 Tax=Rhineura floridana TaxID=261503 RepID=UPI002AC80C44|nr:N-acetyltransferase ESCO1 isoform X2 [Rhineura floridana]